MKSGKSIPAKILGKIADGNLYEQCTEYNDTVYEHSRYAKTAGSASNSVRKRARLESCFENDTRYRIYGRPAENRKCTGLWDGIQVWRHDIQYSGSVRPGRPYARTTEKPWIWKDVRDNGARGTNGKEPVTKVPDSYQIDNMDYQRARTKNINRYQGSFMLSW